MAIDTGIAPSALMAESERMLWTMAMVIRGRRLNRG